MNQAAVLPLDFRCVGHLNALLYFNYTFNSEFTLTLYMHIN